MDNDAVVYHVRLAVDERGTPMTSPRPPSDDASRTVCIVGGAGAVGTRVARLLLLEHDDDCRVVVAGRDLGRAHAAAAALGPRVHSARLDVADASTWHVLVDDGGVTACSVVLVCVDQVDDAFARFVLEHGIGYVDVSADDAFLRRVEALHDVAVANDAVGIVAVGFAPGLTNLLVREAVRDLVVVDDVEVAIFLGPGDAHGEAAIAWTLRELFTPRARLRRSVDFGGDVGRHHAIAFDFADQHQLRRRHGLPTTTLLSLGWLTRPMQWLGQLFAGRVSSSTIAMLSHWLMRVHVGSDACAIAVTARGRDASGHNVVVRRQLHRRREAEVTAQVAAHAVAAVLQRDSRPGVHHLDEVVAFADVVTT